VVAVVVMQLHQQAVLVVVLLAVRAVIIQMVVEQTVPQVEAVVVALKHHTIIQALQPQQVKGVLELLLLKYLTHTLPYFHLVLQVK
jgi:hypothetical protein